MSEMTWKDWASVPRHWKTHVACLREARCIFDGSLSHFINVAWRASQQKWESLDTPGVFYEDDAFTHYLDATPLYDIADDGSLSLKDSVQANPRTIQ